MSAQCTSEPVSWLRLERYHLGEVDGAERAAIDAHLAGCEACAGCLASIAADDASVLPPLPAMLPGRRAAGRSLSRRLVAASGAVALAAAAVLAVSGAWRSRPAELAGAVGIKGGDLAFSLVREDGAAVPGPEGVYRDGDRFKAVVTCPPSLGATFDVVVFDDGGASFPLGPGRRLACGNEVPLPGAFRLTGHGDETVCLVWSSEGAPDRGTMAAGPGGLGAQSACKRLRGGP